MSNNQQHKNDRNVQKMKKLNFTDTTPWQSVKGYQWQQLLLTQRHNETRNHNAP